MCRQIEPSRYQVYISTKLREIGSRVEVALHELCAIQRQASGCSLTWQGARDCMLSAKVFGPTSLIPPPISIWPACSTEPAQVMLAEAHHEDLAGARACGLQTAYVERSLVGNDRHASNSLARAEQLSSHENAAAKVRPEVRANTWAAGRGTCGLIILRMRLRAR